MLLLQDLLLANPVFVQPYPSHDPHLLMAAFPINEKEEPLTGDDIVWNESNVCFSCLFIVCFIIICKSD
jgi:hypothetical protein